MKTAVQFGAGNFGRGLTGALLSQAGYHVIYADVSRQAVIDTINQTGAYIVHVMDVDCRDILISNVSGMDPETPEMADALMKSELVTTAVGLAVLPRLAPLIAQNIARRKAQGCTQVWNIIACENAINAGSQLKQAVYSTLNETERAYADQYVGFSNCLADRLFPPVHAENNVDIVAENYCEWDVEKNTFKGDVPEITGINFVENLTQYLDRRLYIFHTGHVITAYLGMLKGCKTIDEAIADKKIYDIVSTAMKESGDSLICKYTLNKETQYDYIDSMIKRFRNPYLKQDVAEIGREPLRKLSLTDCLIRPMLTAHGYGLSVDCLILGIGAALRYQNPDDVQSAEMQDKRKEWGLIAAIQEITGITDAELVGRIVNAYDAVMSKI